MRDEIIPIDEILELIAQKETLVGKRVEGVSICDEKEGFYSRDEYLKAARLLTKEEPKFDGRKVTHRPGGYTIWPE